MGKKPGGEGTNFNERRNFCEPKLRLGGGVGQRKGFAECLFEC